MKAHLLFAGCALAVLLPRLGAAAPAEIPTFTVRQVTFGPNHHFYGYQGHVGNTPFNRRGTKLALLQVAFQDRLVTSADAAAVVLVDVVTGKTESLTRTRAWNFQQGTMMYWNPAKPNEEIFFNDRAADGSNKVKTVLFNVKTKARREFFFPATPFANSGVAQKGGRFLGINYGRLQRLRPVTGYAEAHDWTTGVQAPQDDGIFLVDIATRRSKLLISYKQLLNRFVGKHPEMGGKELLINHTLWNRDDTRIVAAVRWVVGTKLQTVWFTMNADGSDVRETPNPGHFDWELDQKIVGRYGDETRLYDTKTEQTVEVLDAGFFAADGDVAVAPDTNWIATTAGGGKSRHVKVYSRAARAGFLVTSFDASPYLGNGTTGPTESAMSQNRLDGSPLWSTDSTKIYFTGRARDGSRQGFIADFKWSQPQSRVGSPAGGQKVTHLLMDEVQRMEVPTCDNGDCVNGHNKSSKIYLEKFLPGVRRNMTAPVNFVEEGYWHIVINTLKVEGKNKGPGSTGSIRVTPEGFADSKGAYYLFASKPGTYTEVKNWQEGKATHYKRKFSDWMTYNKFGLPADAWKKPLRYFSFGPVKSQQEVNREPQYACFYCMAPLTFRARVWITTDPDFVPPMNPDDPPAQQPAGHKAAAINPRHP